MPWGDKTIIALLAAVSKLVGFDSFLSKDKFH